MRTKVNLRETSLKGVTPKEHPRCGYGISYGKSIPPGPLGTLAKSTHKPTAPVCPLLYLLGIAGDELGHHAGLLPNLNVVAIYQALGLLDCLSVIRAGQGLAANEMAVMAYNVGSIFGHMMHSNQAGAQTRLSVTDGCRDGAVITKFTAAEF
jgi:hypothetical protein